MARYVIMLHAVLKKRYYYELFFYDYQFVCVHRSFVIYFRTLVVQVHLRVTCTRLIEPV